MSVAGLLKYARDVYPKIPGVRIEELQQDQFNDSYWALVHINGELFRLFVDPRKVREAHGEAELLAAVSAPARALHKVYADGIAEGRKRERDDELRALRAHTEGAYRALRHKTMADAWNAVAATLKEPSNAA